MEIDQIIIGAIVGFVSALTLEKVRDRFIKKRSEESERRDRELARHKEVSGFLKTKDTTSLQDTTISPAWLKVIAVIKELDNQSIFKSPFKLVFSRSIPAYREETSGAGSWWDKYSERYDDGGVAELTYDDLDKLNDKSINVRGTKFFLSSYNLIGRSDECDILLPFDSSISRKHALIHYHGGRFVLYDLDATNGTFINGIRIEEGGGLGLNNGDVIILGDTFLRFDIGKVKEDFEDAGRTLILKHGQKGGSKNKKTKERFYRRLANWFSITNK